MSIRPRIKPCPFCGGKAKVYWNDIWKYEVVKCGTCGATTGKFEDNKGSIKAWNRRVMPTFTTDELDEIRRTFDITIHQIPISHCVEIKKSIEAIVDKCNHALKGGGVE